MDTGAALIGSVAGFPVLIAGLWTLRRRRAERREHRNRLLKRVGVEPVAGTGLELWRPLVRAAELKARQAGLAGNGSQPLLWTLATLTLVGVLLLTLGSGLGPAVSIGAALAAAAGPFYLLQRIRSRRRRFSGQFPDALEAMVRALQAGSGVEGAFRLVAEEFPPPLADEFGRLNRRIQLGVPLPDALRELQRHVGLPEARYFTATVIVQRESGGQLAPVLSQLAQLMRRRALFQGKVRALTAESRFTAWFIGLSPLLYLGYTYLFDRGSLAFFLHDPTGLTMLRFALGLIAIGWLLLHQMTRLRF